MEISKVVLTFESVDVTLWFDHSNEISSAGPGWSKRDWANPGLASILNPVKWLINENFALDVLVFSFDFDLSSSLALNFF